MIFGKYRAVLALSFTGLSLTGCDTEFISACYSCLEGDSSDPVSNAEAKKIGVIGNGSRLPVNAQRVYYYEECGIDCIQYVRFDLPTAEAVAYAELVRPLVEGPVEGFSWPEVQAQKLKWWPDTAKLTGNVSHSRSKIGVENDPLIDFVVQKNESNATVFLKSWNM